MSVEKFEFRPVTGSEGAGAIAGGTVGLIGAAVLIASSRAPYEQAETKINKLEDKIDVLYDVYADINPATYPDRLSAATFIENQLGLQQTKLRTEVDKSPPPPNPNMEVGAMFGLPIVGAALGVIVVNRMRHRSHVKRQHRNTKIILEDETKNDSEGVIKRFVDELNVFDARRSS